MTEPTYTLTQELSNRLQEFLDDCHSSLGNDLRSLTPNSGEPVAWSVTVGNKFENCIEITHCKKDAVAQYEESTAGGFESIYTIHELFDHPAPSTKPAEPLKNADILQGCKDVGIADSVGYMEVFELGVKYAERHHNIAAAPQGETK